MKTITTKIIIEGIRARKDGSLGITISTPELKPEEKTLFFELQNLNCEAQITPLEEKTESYVVDTDLNQKSQSQRIRHLLYLNWKREPEGLEFPEYYQRKTEKYIEFLKRFLDE